MRTRIPLMMVAMLSACSSGGTAADGGNSRTTSTPDAAIGTCTLMNGACVASSNAVACCGANGWSYDQQNQCVSPNFVRACETLPPGQGCIGGLDTICFSRSAADGGIAEVFVSSSSDGRGALPLAGFARCNDALNSAAMGTSRFCP